MTAKTAVAMGRALLTFRSSSSSYLVLPKRLFSSSSSFATRSLHLPGFSRPVRSTVSLSHSLRVFAPGSVRLNTIRCCVNSSDGTYSPPRYTGFNFDAPPLPVAPPRIPGCDFRHWFIVMDDSCGQGLTKQKMIDCYVETLTNVVGSVEEAKKRIYNVHCDRVFGFGCKIDFETSQKLKGLPGVNSVIPDSYMDEENKDYGGELYVNGEIVQRSPERQKMLMVFPPE